MKKTERVMMMMKRKMKTELVKTRMYWICHLHGHQSFSLTRTSSWIFAPMVKKQYSIRNAKLISMLNVVKLMDW